MPNIKIPTCLYRDEERELQVFLNKVYHVDRVKPATDVQDAPILVERLSLNCYDKSIIKFFKPTPLYEDFDPYTEAEERAIITRRASITYYTERIRSHNLKFILNYSKFFNIELRQSHYDYVRFFTINVNREHLYSFHHVLPYEYEKQIKWMVEHIFCHQNILGISIEKGKQKLNPYLHYHIIFYQPPRKTKEWVRRVKHLLNPNHNKFYPMTPNPVIKESELRWDNLLQGLQYFLGVSPQGCKLKGDAYKVFVHWHIANMMPANPMIDISDIPFA